MRTMTQNYFPSLFKKKIELTKSCNAMKTVRKVAFMRE